MRRIAIAGIFLMLACCGQELRLDPPMGAAAPVSTNEAGTEFSVFEDGGGSNIDARPGTLSSVYTPSLFAPFFVDEFTRTDGPLGNGWFEKTSGAFAISGEVVRQQAVSNYSEHLLLRPEVKTDVEVSASIILGSDVTAWHMLVARAQSSSNVSAQINAYTLCVNAVRISIGVYSDDGTKRIGPCGSFAVISSTLVTGKSYRVFLRVRGTDIVTIEGAIFDDVHMLGVIRYEDTGPYRVPAAGRTGIGSGSAGTRWDNYQITDP